jgi:hypothetical protein
MRYNKIVTCYAAYLNFTGTLPAVSQKYPPPPNVTTCLCGLRGPPSWAWQEYNRLLSLGRREAQLRCPDYVSGDRGGCSARGGLEHKFY